MNKPEIYKKDQKYNIIYSDQDGKDHEFKFTPEEDMTKPKMIMKCKETNEDFVKVKEIKKLEEGVHKMEETKKLETLADIIEDRYKKGLDGLDVGDNTIDMIVYFDYNPEDVTNSADTYSKCLDTIATGTKVVNYDEEEAYAVVDFYNYVIDHLNAFTNNFTINIDPADGEDNETIAANIVEGILPGLFSGYTNDHTYNSLDTDLLMGVQKKEVKKESFESGNKTFELKLDIRNLADDDEEGPLSDEAITAATSDEFAQKFGKALANELSKTNLEYTDEGNITLFNGQVSGKYCFGYEGVISLGESKGKKEESFEDNKKFSAGEILAIIDNYIHSDDIPNLFDKMGITQEIYEGDEDIPDGKIQDIIEVGLQWLFDHLQPEDYKRVLKNDLEMTDEEMEKYGVELNESKKIEEDNENLFKPEVNNIYFLDNNLIWDQRIGDLAIGIGLSQLESIKEAEDQSGVTVDENIKKYLEEHPANLFIVEGQIPNIKVTLLGDQSGNPVKIDNLRVGG